MKEIRVRFVEDDVERVFYERPADPKAPAKVEIVTAGLGSLVYINGQRLSHVMSIELPVTCNEISPQIVLKLHASDIVQRTVSSQEFKRLVDG